MPKNIVFITAIEESMPLDYEEFCYKTWQWWCEKHGFILYVLKEPILDIKIMDSMWQRYFVYRVMKDKNIDYDQIALVDLDTMVRWDCPDFFKLTNKELSVTVDHDSLGWIYKSINRCQQFFPDIELSWLDYFNCGFMIVSKKHKDLFDKVLNFYNHNINELLKLGNEPDQTLTNFLVKRHGYTVNFLPKTYNLAHLHRKDILLNKYFINLGYVWHFNGFDKRLRSKIMGETWKTIEKQYK